MDASTWYYAAGQDQKGPFTVEQVKALLRDKVVDRDTYVWTPTLSDWQPLAQTELAALLSAPPPRAPTWPMAPPLNVAAAPPANANVGMTPRNAAQADFVGAVKTCFSKFVTWQGRAARPEFWYFILFCVGVGICASAIDAVLSLKSNGVGVFSSAANLALFLPNLAVGVRRLHDTNRSAWWLLLSFIPLVGIIVLIVFWCQQGDAGENRYGSPTSL